MPLLTIVGSPSSVRRHFPLKRGHSILLRGTHQRGRDSGAPWHEVSDRITAVIRKGFRQSSPFGLENR
jgi:hypothetical protein